MFVLAKAGPIKTRLMKASPTKYKSAIFAELFCIAVLPEMSGDYPAFNYFDPPIPG